MPTTKDLAAVVKKWTTRAPQAAPYYEEGVRNPRADWEQATLAGEENYKAAVIAAANEGRQGKGVRKAGTRKWQEGAIKKGVSRFGPGVVAAAGEYQASMSEVLATIERTDIGPRYPTGDPRNYDRVKKLGEALRQAKLDRS